GLILEDDLGSSGGLASERDFRRLFNSMIRVRIGINTKDYVFLHAGTVGFNGKAVIVPGNSYSGKTTLVAELVKAGCEYYSDEYAILDRDGMVHPFARDLSVRHSETDIRDVSVESLSGREGNEPLPVGAVFLTKFE